MLKREVPKTPNLEEEKLHIKQNAKKRQMTARPPVHCWIDSKGKQSDEQRMSVEAETLCTRCRMAVSSQRHPSLNKVNTIKEFKSKLSKGTNKLNEIHQTLERCNTEDKEKNDSLRSTVSSAFDTMRMLMQMKENELTSRIDRMQRESENSRAKQCEELKEMRVCFDRYLSDIEANYDDIINELELDRFQDIMERYNNKLIYFLGKMQQIEHQRSNDLNLELPINEVEGALNKMKVNGCMNSNYSTQSTTTNYFAHPNSTQPTQPKCLEKKKDGSTRHFHKHSKENKE